MTKEDKGWSMPLVEDEARVEVDEISGRKTVTVTQAGVTVSRVIMPRKPGDGRVNMQRLGSRYAVISRRSSGKNHDFENLEGLGLDAGDGPLS